MYIKLTTTNLSLHDLCTDDGVHSNQSGFSSEDSTDEEDNDEIIETEIITFNNDL